ncbi:hypothetical protein SELMODRAFT_403885 [Selaginella moellendorffii]|uniref:Uncharacterized protein n=1 Tax=Selaginella moellendorffii TaxID=88036 RepID=D8QSV6_SELML|nr:hypothetical protein SELMODRAFT_403885 [Selaginella moellendorffii]
MQKTSQTHIFSGNHSELWVKTPLSPLKLLHHLRQCCCHHPFLELHFLPVSTDAPSQCPLLVSASSTTCIRHLLSRKLALHRQRQLLAALDLFGTSASSATRPGHTYAVHFVTAPRRTTRLRYWKGGENGATVEGEGGAAGSDARVESWSSEYWREQGSGCEEQYGLSRVKSVRTCIQGKDKFAYVVVDDAFDTAARLGFLGTNH